MDIEKVHLTKEKETLLATLYAKALDSRNPNPILGDKYADEVARKIDYDFTRIHAKFGEVTVPIRAKHFDEWTREFLAANPTSIVLHLGCGLDSRVFRIDPPATVQWYDVDYPEVIELRKRLFPERRDYTLIGSSVTDLKWLDQIPRDQHVLVVAEGLTYYLPEKEGIALFNRIVERFPHGEFIFDAFSRLMIKLCGPVATFRVAGVSLRWGIDDPRELEKQVPRLKLVTEADFRNKPEIIARWPWTQSKIYRLVCRITFVKRMTQVLRYRF